MELCEDYFEYATGYEPALPQTKHTLAERMWRFFKMGVEHIFLGYDHICFLMALIVVSRFGQIVKIVTSFTIAHSITLILAALDIVRVPTRLVETAIAATIVYVAVENMWRGDAIRRSLTPDPRSPTPQRLASGPPPFSHRWLLTFFFGLVHGFGFANILRELGLPTEGLIRCLLAFNVGVEAGQLAIAFCLLPFAWFLNYWRHGRLATFFISLILALFGAAWFIDRLFALDWLERIGL